MAVPDADTRHAMVRWVSRGRTATSTELRLEELRRLRDGCEKVRRGELLVSVVEGEARFEKVAS